MKINYPLSECTAVITQTYILDEIIEILWVSERSLHSVYNEVRFAGVLEADKDISNAAGR